VAELKAYRPLFLCSRVLAIVLERDRPRNLLRTFRANQVMSRNLLRTFRARTRLVRRSFCPQITSERLCVTMFVTPTQQHIPTYRDFINPRRLAGARFFERVDKSPSIFNHNTTYI
jgi:hypothetical protein